MTTVGIVEDNDTVRETLREWINDAPNCRCACACATSKEALIEIPSHRPNVVLMDINLPGGESGITCTAQLKQLLPKLQIIMVTVYKDHDRIYQALQAGACGYLLKRSSRDEILRSIAEVQTGGAPMTGEIARMLIETFRKPPAKSVKSIQDNLSTREMDILGLVANGLSNKEIASQLNISFDTVRNHLRHIYEKLHVRCRTEAVMQFINAGSFNHRPLSEQK